MNVVWAVAHHPFAERVGWILLHSLWQGAVIGVGFCLVRLVLRKQAAQARYLAGCVCLTLTIGTPLLTLFLTQGSLRENDIDFSAVMANSSSPAAEAQVFPVSASYEKLLLTALQTTALFFGRLAPWLAMTWLLGVAFSSCRLLRSFWWVRTIRRK